MIKLDAAQKLLNSPLIDFYPASLLEAKRTMDSGYLLELGRLYSTMYHEWSTLQKDVADTMDAVSALDWSVAPWVEPGGKPTARAQQVADTVAAAIWQASPQEPGTFAHGFLDLVGAMLDGLYRGVSVHEIVWARTAELVYPAEYRQVPPQYYMWETRTGHEDRLLMVRDGMSYTEAEPFPANRFIIALNTTGSDHPIFNSVYYSLIGYFAAAKFGLPWMQEYCQRYGHPIFSFKADNEADLATLRAQLDAQEDIYRVFLRSGSEMQVTPIPASTGIPHEALLRVAESACHQAILGQTLTSDTSEHGGSRAQAEVHMGVQKSIILKRAEYVARVLNRQLVPAIVAANYGSTGGVPMPELRFAIPDDGANTERAAYWAAVLAIPGISVAREHIYESLRLPIPAEGDDTLGGEPSSPPASPRTGSADTTGSAPAEPGEKLTAATPAPAAGGHTLPGAYTAPARRQLEQWLAEGLTLAQMRERLGSLRFDTAALAGSLASTFTQAIEGAPPEKQSDAVGAANPYGCNGAGHKPGCKHGSGTSSAADSGSSGDDQSSDDDAPTPAEVRQEEREHLEELLAELDRQEEAARDAEASGDPAHYNEDAARDRWSALSREGDPQTREGIERRLAEMERADRADEIRKTEAGKTIQATLDSLKERKAGEAPSAEHHLLDKVDSDTVDEVKKICGRDVSGYRHSISAAGISHAKNRHPYLTDDDIMLLPDITSSYDSIKYEHSKSKGARLCYAKTYGDTTFEVVERIGRSNTRQSQQRLYFVTEYIAKHPADQQKPK